MKNRKILKKIVVFATTFTIIISSMISSSIDVFAKEEYRLELFNQLADKVTSLYYKEAIVSLEMLDEIYSDPSLIENIRENLQKDSETQEYLLKRGFDEEKITEILRYINRAFPSVEDMKNDDDKNIIKRLIKNSLVEENKTLSFSEYNEDIKHFGEELYEILPNGVKDHFDIYFETQEEKSGAIIKIIVEFIYSGHGKSIYDENTKGYIDLKLMTNDRFIESVNHVFDIDILNRSSKKSINIFLDALEETIKSKKLDRVYSDISSVLNLVDTNYGDIKRQENLPKEASRIIDEKDITRAEILKIIVGFLNIEPQEYTGEFKDVESDNFYAGYIATGKSIGIVSGYNDNTFRPNSKVTLSETMSIISNTVEYLYGGTKLTTDQIDKALENFEHKDKIEPWARRSFANLLTIGILKNNYKEKEDIDEFITREEAINMIYKIENLKIND